MSKNEVILYGTSFAIAMICWVVMAVILPY